MGAMAFLSDSRVGVSRMVIARPHEAQKRTFSEHKVPQPEQVTIADGLYRTARWGSEASFMECAGALLN